MRHPPLLLVALYPTTLFPVHLLAACRGLKSLWLLSSFSVPLTAPVTCTSTFFYFFSSLSSSSASQSLRFSGHTKPNHWPQSRRLQPVREPHANQTHYVECVVGVWIVHPKWTVVCCCSHGNHLDKCTVNSWTFNRCHFSDLLFNKGFYYTTCLFFPWLSFT